MRHKHFYHHILRNQPSCILVPVTSEGLILGIVILFSSRLEKRFEGLNFSYPEDVYWKVDVQDEHEKTQVYELDEANTYDSINEHFGVVIWSLEMREKDNC